MLKKVVLPAPFGPMSDTMEPLGMSKSTLLTASNPPNRFVTPAGLDEDRGIVERASQQRTRTMSAAGLRLGLDVECH